MTEQQHHATCVSIGEDGVLLRGPSGAGKSDVALRLIDDGAVLVADDRTDIVCRDGRLIASAPEPIAGQMEVRGLGIVRLPRRTEVTLSLLVDLTHETEPERLPIDRHQTFMGIRMRHMTASGIAASTPAKIRLALGLKSDDLIEPS